MEKSFKKYLGFVVAVVMMILGGGGFAMANDANLASPVGRQPAVDANGTQQTPQTGALNGPGTGVSGGQWQGDTEQTMEGEHDYDWYQKEINKRIVEMKLESCPIDQILRASSRTNHAGHMVVTYYQIGQRPITSKVAAGFSPSAQGSAVALPVENKTVFDAMDTILFPTIQGYKEDGTTRDPYHPLMARVIAQSVTQDPMVIAINGKKNAQHGNRFDFPTDIAEGTPLLRLGRAAGEKDVETASYYELPDPSEQYCQRFIMQAEESIIERMMTKVVDWDFSKQERIAMDDMRGGIERSGLFGIKSMTRYGKNGNVYTTGGIYWEAGKDIKLGHWQVKMENGKEVKYTTDDGEKTVYEYVINEKELTSFVNEAIHNAGNGSRTKMLFVDNLIYQALSNLKSEKRIIMESESNYENMKLDFESFKSMGTKIMIYRHDAFNYMGMSGSAFLLDPRYLEKWVFGDWQRKEYNLKDLFIRNSNAVVMEEFSCWTLYFPDAHARVSRPEFTGNGITDEAMYEAA